MKRLIVAVVVLASPWIPSAQAGQDCVTYSVTAPVAGTRSDTRCVPVVLPSPFLSPFDTGNCKNVPPAGYSSCVSARVYTP